MKLEGYTYPEIAAALKCDEVTAWRSVKRGLDKSEQRAAESADRLRHVEIRRLDKLLKALQPGIEKGNIGAIGRAIEIGARRAKLLGLDVPAKLEVTGNVIVNLIDD